MDNVLKKAITDTSAVKEEAPVEEPKEPTTEEDGTVTIPHGILPEETKEGDIVQFEYVTSTDEGCVLKPVESRIKQEGAGAEDVKAAGTDNSSAKEVVGEAVNKYKKNAATF